MAIIYVKDTSGKIIHIEENFSSLVWTERYQKHGEFVMDIPIEDVNADAYIDGNYIVFDESDFTMIIEKIEIRDDPDELIFEVSGRTLSSILERRINASKLSSLYDNEKIAYSGYFKDVVTGIVNDDIIDPYMETYEPVRNDSGDIISYEWVKVSTPERKIFNFSYVDSVPQIEISKNYSDLKTIYELIESISKTYVTGFKIDLTQTGGFIFKTYKGVDHTTDQYVNSPLIFGPIMDNVTRMNTYQDSSDYKNAAFTYQIADKSSITEGVSPTRQSWVFNPKDTGTPSGLNRREFLVGEFNESSESEDTIETKAKEEYDSGDYDMISLSEGEIDPLVRYGIDKDYYIGDIVESIDHFGNSFRAIIDEVVRSYDSSGYIVTPNFSNMMEYDYGEEE